MEKSIDKNSPTPYYLQVKDILTKKIANNEFEDSKLWSEGEISKRLGVTVATVRNALEKMRQENIIYTIKGVGTFISKPKLEFDLYKYLSIGRMFKGKGIKEDINTLNTRIVNYKKSIFEDYNINKPSSKLVNIKRVRNINNEPVVYENVFLNNDICSSIIEEDKGVLIYNYIVINLKINLKSIEEYIEPKNLNLIEAKILNREVGDASLLVVRISHDFKDRFIEYRKILIRGDKCRYYMKLK